MKMALKIIVLTLWSQMALAAASLTTMNEAAIDKKLKALEHKFDGKIGLYVIDTNSGKIISYRENQLFPFQSTFKFMGVAALLHHEQSKPVLQKRIFINPEQLVAWHPISGLYLKQQVSLQTLAEGAMSYSDNTAINLIVRELGGLKKINDFARMLGNNTFNLRHYEVNLNSSPQSNEDSSTPKDMALSVKNILLGKLLNPHHKQLLIKWMRNNTTGYARIRAGVPLGWVVADKTGSGSYGIANDIGVVWSPSCKPIVLSIYTYQNKQTAIAQEDIIAKITQMVLEQLSKYDSCFHGHTASTIS